MYEHQLLTSQKNQVLRAITSQGLDPFNFRWATELSDTARDTTVPVLVYEDGGNNFYFQFDILANNALYSVFSPGFDRFRGAIHAANWEIQLVHAKQWLVNLKREITQPDLWGDLEKYRLEGQDAVAQVVNDPFTINQAEQIRIGIEKIASYLEQFTKDNQQQTEFVDGQLAYLVDASKRQGKRDWMHTAIGVIMTIVTALALPPDEAKTIWHMLKAAVSGILQLPH